VVGQVGLGAAVSGSRAAQGLRRRGCSVASARRCSGGRSRKWVASARSCSNSWRSPTS
jgi:hypothetical protein